MVTPDSLPLWLQEQAWPLGVLLLLVALAYLTLKVSAWRRSAALARARKGVTEQTFVAYLSRFDFDPLITGATFRYMREVHLVQFPILPSDALDEDLGLDCEGVDGTVSELLQMLHREELPGLRDRPLLTVEDLIRLLQASPRKIRSAAAA